MAIFKAIHGAAKSHAGLRNTLEYVLREAKVKDGYVETLGPMPEELNWDSAYKAFLDEKKLQDKDSGRMCAHYVLSFHADEKITPEQVLEFGKSFAEQAFKGYQSIIAVHQDRDHLHCHFVVNSVSYELCQNKLHTSKKDLQRWKDLINEMCRERGLSVAEKGRHFDGTEIEQGSAIAWTKNKYQLLNRDGEKKTASGKQSKRQSSYLLNCATAVLDSLEKSADKDEFIHEMGERGWSVNWKDSRKNITFENKQGNKVRDSNLTKNFNQNFSKEELLHELERQKEIRAKQAARREAEQERIATEERELDEYYRQVESAVEGLDTEAVDGNRSTEEADSRSDGEDTKAVIRDARDAVRNNRSDNRAVRHAETESEIAEEQSVASAEQRRLAEQQRAEDESRNRRNNFSHGDYYSR